MIGTAAGRSGVVAASRATAWTEGHVRRPAFRSILRGSCSPGRTATRSTLTPCPGTFHKRVKAAGLDDIRFHDLRHTFASLMLAAGVEPKKVQAALGHSSIMVTMDTYGHLMPGAGKDAAHRFAEYLEA